MARDPYCGNCGYSLRGLTESSKCPECGKPIVEVLQRDRSIPRGKRYKSKTVLFGLPLVHIATGAHEDERYGKARGIIAIGDIAVGWFALGNALAAGIVALGGGGALGVVAIGGGISLGLLALAGLAVGGVALGGGAIGGIAFGGGAAGFIAEGGGALGYYARAGGAFGKHLIDWANRDPEAVRLFTEWSWLFGSNLTGINWTLPCWFAIAAGGIIILLGLLVMLAYLLRP
jgi:hypothetical protein